MTQVELSKSILGCSRLIKIINNPHLYFSVFMRLNLFVKVLVYLPFIVWSEILLVEQSQLEFYIDDLDQYDDHV